MDAGAFYGIGAAVIAIIARSAGKLVKMTMGPRAFVDGVTAAATGAIAGAAFVLGRRPVVDLPTIRIFAATLLALFKLKKVPEPLLILVGGIVGIALP